MTIASLAGLMAVCVLASSSIGRTTEMTAGCDCSAMKQSRDRQLARSFLTEVMQLAASGKTAAGQIDRLMAVCERRLVSINPGASKDTPWADACKKLNEIHDAARTNER